MVNGVTKRITPIGFEYQFLLAIIRTNTATNSMAISTRGQSDVVYIQFNLIPDTLGATDIEGYVDALAEAGEYSSTSEGQTAGNAILESINGKILAPYSTNGTGVQTSDYEATTLVLLQAMGDTLETIKFLLQSIASK